MPSASSSSRPGSSASQATPKAAPRSSPSSVPAASRRAPPPTPTAYGRSTWSLADPRAALWRGKMYIDGQFSWGMLEWWEQVLVGLVVTLLTALFWYSLIFHFPQHARGAARRASYYIWGAGASLGGAAPADGALLSSSQLVAEKARVAAAQTLRVEL